MLFNETVKWKIIVKFFENPDTEFYVKELSRELKISPGSASNICFELEKEGILKSQTKARALFYSLKNYEPLVQRLKSAWSVSFLVKFRDCWENPEIQSFALYGSYSSGAFVSRSDIDILIITNVEDSIIEAKLEKIKKAFGDKLSLTFFTIAKWHKLAKEKDRFYIEVLSNHIVLYGSSLVIG